MISSNDIKKIKFGDVDAKHHANIGEELVKVFQDPYSFPFNLNAAE
jgi:hypothetical protein